jgi:DNA repair protein RecO (recombination protein O)
VPAIPDQAVCIRHWDWSETSQTVSLFTRDHGLVRGLAKGSKRERSNFSGGIDLLTRGQVMMILKPSADLATLTAWDLQEIFPALRSSLNAFYAAMYAADLVLHTLHDRDPHPALFDQLLAALRALGTPDRTAAALFRFQWATLVETGYRPELDADVATGEPLPAAAAYSFAPRLGGFTTEAPAPSWRVRAETLSLLRSPDTGPVSPATLDRANRLLAAYTREILGREIPAAAALFGELTV